MANETETDMTDYQKPADRPSGGESPENVVLASRRRFTQAGVAAPIVMSLSGRSVWAGEAHGQPAACPSAQMSGNLSHEHQLECVLGWSPGGWKNLGGEITGGATADAWITATGTADDVPVPGLSAIENAYGVLNANANANKCDSYTGGFTLEDAGFGGLYSGLDRPLREVLCEESGSELWHAVAAWLNAGAVVGYPFSKQDVLDLFAGLKPLPPGVSFNEYMDQSWNGPFHFDYG